MGPSRFLLASLIAALLASPGWAQATPKVSDLDSVFGKDGGVLVPYDELLRLIRGESTAPPPATVKRASTYVLVGAQVKGTADDAVVRCEATVDVDLVGSGGWVLVPVGLDEAALESAEVTRKTKTTKAIVGTVARLAERLPQGQRPRTSTGYGVLLRGLGRRTLRLTFTLPVRRQPGQASFSLTLPGAALSKLDVALPKGSLGPSVGGALASTPGKESLKGFFKANARATVRWTPRTRLAVRTPTAARKALVYAETDTAVRLEEGLLKTTSRVSYRVHQAPVSELRVRLPKGATFLNAKASIRGPRGEINLPLARYPRVVGPDVIVNLRSARQGEFAITLRLEQLLPEGATKLSIPAPQPLGAERSSGRVAVRASKILALEPSTTQGLSKKEATDFPANMLSSLGWSPGQDQPPLVYRYPRQPWSLQVAVRQVKAELEGRLFTLAVVRDEEIGLATTIQTTVRKRPIFSLRLALPEGYQLLEFGDPKQIRDRRIEDTGQGKVLVVHLARPLAPGVSHLTVFGLVRRDAEANEIKLPHLRLLGAVKQSGVIGVGASAHLRLSARAKEGLWALGLADLTKQGFPLGVKQGEELVFGYRHGQGEGLKATFAVEKRQPRVRARTETLVDAREDLVRVESKVRLDVEFAGILSVRIEGPAGLKNVLVFDRGGIAATDVVVKGDTATWTLTLQGKRSGSFVLGYHYAVKLDDFTAGQQKVVTLAPLKVLDCARQTEEIAVKKHENLVLADRSRELVETRDPREVAQGLRRSGVIRAYRVQGWPYRLSLEITKYDFRSPEGILVRHLHQDEVVTDKGGLQAEAIIKLQNRAAQYLRVLMPAGAVVRGLMVNGKKEPWREGEAKDGRPTILIVLGQVTKARQGEPFQVRIRYKAPLAIPGAVGAIEPTALAFPTKEGWVPVARHTRTLYLPEGYAYLSFGVEGTKHFAEQGVWTTLTGWLRALRGQPIRPRQLKRGARATQQAIARLKAMSGQRAGLYEPLEAPHGRTPYLFERLDGGLKVSVQAMAWPLFYLLDLLILLAVVAAGFVLDKKKLVPSPWLFPLVAGAIALTGGAVAGRALEPFFAAAFLGAVGLVAFFLLRGAVRELTERRTERKVERTEREAQVARERAAAAEAEARLQEVSQPEPEPEPVGAGASSPSSASPGGSAEGQ
jgi:uncharacterized membrane protein